MLTSGAFSNAITDVEGTGGDIHVQSRNLEVFDGAVLSASSSGNSNAGNVILSISETARFEGNDPINERPSGVFTSIAGITPNAKREEGDVRIQARNLEMLDGAQLVTGTFGNGNAGSIILVINETARFGGTSTISASGAPSSVAPNARGAGGDVRLRAENVEINDGASLFADSLGQGNSGNILLTAHNQLSLRDSQIATNAEQDAGGQIQIDADNIFLFGDSDIQTFVNSGENDGGNITIRANALVALDDSDILSFAADGRGGDVDLSETAFFGQNFQFAPRGTEPRTLDNNDRVDINATGGIASGTVSLADVSFVEDSLNELPDNLVNPETLVAGSCVARSSDTDSSFTITGSDGLREQPSNSSSTYSLESVQSIPDDMESALLAEPQGTYRLTDGRLVLGRECNTDG